MRLSCCLSVGGGEICLGEAYFADLATSIARYSGVLSVMQAAPFDDVPRSAAGRQ